MPQVKAHADSVAARDERVWDALWENRPIGRLAVAVIPGKERRERARQLCSGLQLNQPKALPPRWTEQWRDGLIDSLAALRAQMQLSGDSFPALCVPRTQPFELRVAEEDIPLWNRLCRKSGVPCALET